MDDYLQIRLLHRDGLSIREIAKRLGHGRDTVNKALVDKEGRPLAADAFENDNNHLLDCLKGFFGSNPAHVQRMVQVYGV